MKIDGANFGIIDDKTSPHDVLIRLSGKIRKHKGKMSESVGVKGRGSRFGVYLGRRDIATAPRRSGQRRSYEGNKADHARTGSHCWNPCRSWGRSSEMSADTVSIAPWTSLGLRPTSRTCFPACKSSLNSSAPIAPPAPRIVCI